MRSLAYGGDVAFATYHDLWLEAGDPEPMAHFWAGALCLDAQSLSGGAYRLGSPRPEQTIYVVPADPGTLRGFRIHADVDLGQLAAIRWLGAEPEGDEEDPWLVLHGPEDSELRCYPSPEPIPDRRYEMVLPATQPIRAARWWARVFGAVYESAAGGDYAWVSQVPHAPFETLLFTDAGSLPAHRRVRMRLTTADMPGLIRYGAAMVSGQLPWVPTGEPGGPGGSGEPSGSGLDAPGRPTYVMRCAEGVEFIVVDVSGAPEAARSPRPAKPALGPR